jgi:hypothetical protein
MNSGEQYRWLEKDLAKVDRSVTPWLVAGWHAPWYSTYKAHYREAECMRVAMEELLYSYGLDIAFTGHVNSHSLTLTRLISEPSTTVVAESDF